MLVVTLAVITNLLVIILIKLLGDANATSAYR